MLNIPLSLPRLDGDIFLLLIWVKSKQKLYRPWMLFGRGRGPLLQPLLSWELIQAEATEEKGPFWTRVKSRNPEIYGLKSKKNCVDIDLNRTFFPLAQSLIWAQSFYRVEWELAQDVAVCYLQCVANPGQRLAVFSFVLNDCHRNDRNIFSLFLSDFTAFFPFLHRDEVVKKSAKKASNTDLGQAWTFRSLFNFVPPLLAFWFCSVGWVDLAGVLEPRPCTLVLCQVLLVPCLVLAWATLVYINTKKKALTAVATTTYVHVPSTILVQSFGSFPIFPSTRLPMHAKPLSGQDFTHADHDCHSASHRQSPSRGRFLPQGFLLSDGKDKMRSEQKQWAWFHIRFYFPLVPFDPIFSQILSQHNQDRALPSRHRRCTWLPGASWSVWATSNEFFFSLSLFAPFFLVFLWLLLSKKTSLTISNWLEQSQLSPSSGNLPSFSQSLSPHLPSGTVGVGS